ncbi:hypothetical protein JTE90_020950 [Oedothorax gibbosus]|uniref:Uncharacterized protein n=1 Tax=Oedothorax gibbosus TaxID=931172 RepID=A0AAV6TIP2_9ARAC|nr:hypothetical protein JTE90_020950 [Oedothorax gibbosus]
MSQAQFLIMESVSAAPENKNVNEEETNSSSSDNFFEKIAPKICEKENKAWEVESTSSGSEYMDISFYQQQEAVKPANSKLMPSTPKHQNVLKNKPLPNGQQKRENQDVFSENTLVKRPCGNTPSRGTPQGLTFRKQPVQDSFWTRPFRTPDKLIAGTPEHNMDKVNYQKTPTITPQRRFFKTPVVNRDEKFKKPKLPWF